MRFSPWDIAGDADTKGIWKPPGLKPHLTAAMKEKASGKESKDEEEGPPSSQSTLMPSCVITIGILVATFAVSFDCFVS